MALMKEHHRTTRRATSSIFQVCANIHYQRLDGGFKSLRKLFEVKKHSLSLGKRVSKKWFAERLHSMWRERMHTNFMLLRAQGEHNFKGRRKLSQILHHRCACRKRSAFYLWKHSAEAEMVNEDNEHWEGPASLARW